MTHTGCEGTPTEIDMRGARCPAPIIALGRHLRSGGAEDVVLLADDPAADVDVSAWCRMTGAQLRRVEPGDNHTRYVIRLPR